MYTIWHVKKQSAAEPKKTGPLSTQERTLVLRHTCGKISPVPRWRIREEIATYPARTARPALFALVKMPEVRTAPNSKNTSTIANFAVAFSMNESAIMGQNNIRIKVTLTKTCSVRLMVDSEYVSTTIPLLLSVVFWPPCKMVCNSRQIFIVGGKVWLSGIWANLTSSLRNLRKDSLWSIRLWVQDFSSKSIAATASGFHLGPFTPRSFTTLGNGVRQKLMKLSKNFLDGVLSLLSLALASSAASTDHQLRRSKRTRHLHTIIL